MLWQKLDDTATSQSLQNVQGQIGQCLEQPGLEGVPAHGRELGTGWYLRSLPNHSRILWFLLLLPQKYLIDWHKISEPKLLEELLEIVVISQGYAVVKIKPVSDSSCCLTSEWSLTCNHVECLVLFSSLKVTAASPGSCCPWVVGCWAVYGVLIPAALLGCSTSTVWGGEM